MDVLNPETLSFPFLNSSSSEEEEMEEAMTIVEEEPQAATNKRKLLSKQLSMRETTREAKWEKRRQQIHDRRTRMMMMMGAVCEETEDAEEEEEERRRRRRGRVRSLTDEDLDELRGSIELGFGFDEENGGHNLRDTLPALDLYFAVNRQLSEPKLWSSSSPTGTSSTAASSSCSNLLGGTPSPRSPYAQEQRSSNASDSWKICSPGDDPQHVKMRLRQWAQVVACSVRQSC